MNTYVSRLRNQMANLFMIHFDRLPDDSDALIADFLNAVKNNEMDFSVTIGGEPEWEQDAGFVKLVRETIMKKSAGEIEKQYPGLYAAMANAETVVLAHRNRVAKTEIVVEEEYVVLNADDAQKMNDLFRGIRIFYFYFYSKNMFTEKKSPAVSSKVFFFSFRIIF